MVSRIKSYVARTWRTHPACRVDKGGKWQVSNNGGVYPMFSRNGRELFFRIQDSRMIFVANYTVKGDSFVAEKPRVWSDKPLADTGFSGSNYDVAPDGRRIAALFSVESPEAQRASARLTVRKVQALGRAEARPAGRKPRPTPEH